MADSTPSSYRFPFDTCEPVSKRSPYAAQPVSALVNAVSTVAILALCAWSRPRAEVAVVLMTYAAFEAWHTWSHVRHVPGSVQKRVVHALGIVMAMATLWMIQSLTRARFPPAFTAVLLALLAADALSVWAGQDLLGIATGLAIFAWAVAGRWSILPDEVANAMASVLLPGVLVLMLLLANESRNCERMLAWRSLPYHALVEVLGLVLFVTLSVVWVRWGAATASRRGA